MAALPDGRAVLAYTTSADGVAGALYDGATWTAMPAIPGATVAAYSSAVTLAPGAEPGVVAEIVFQHNAIERAYHTRLTDAASWTWTVPVAIAGTDNWADVHLAARP
jgi:hypothetical protein